MTLITTMAMTAKTAASLTRRRAGFVWAGSSRAPTSMPSSTTLNTPPHRALSSSHQRGPIVTQSRIHRPPASPRIHSTCDSVPQKGYEWCARCGIRSHRFQKKVGAHNPCLDSPRMLGFGICNPAKNYWRQQRNVMLFLGILCFGILPSDFLECDEGKEDW